MKKLLLCLTLMIPFNVYAFNFSFNGNDVSTEVGKNVNTNLIINTTSPIVGVKFNYKTSGNIELISTNFPGSTNTSGNGRVILSYGENTKTTGSIIATFTVKCERKGKGYIDIYSIEASDGNDYLSNQNNKSIIITCIEPTPKPKPSTNNNSSSSSSNSTSNTLEAKKLETQKLEAQKKLEEATQAVEKVEKSLNEEDYNNALSKVNGLDNNSDKAKLLERLNKTKVNIKRVEDLTKEDLTKEDLTIEAPNVKEKMTDNSILWMLLSVIFLLIGLGEAAYIVLLKRNKE